MVLQVFVAIGSGGYMGTVVGDGRLGVGLCGGGDYYDRFK